MNQNNKQKNCTCAKVDTCAPKGDNILTVIHDEPYGFTHKLTSPNDRIEKVVFEGFEKVTKLHPHSGYLLGKYKDRCSEITSVDLSGLSNITSIHDNFLEGFTALHSIDLSPLKNVPEHEKNAILKD